MKRARQLVRRWLHLDDLRRDTSGAVQSLDVLSRQVAELRGLLHQQSEFTVEALRRAGWQSEDDVAGQEALQRALRAIHGTGDVIAGPWTGEVGFELLYWIPFLNWLVAQGLDGRRLVILSRGGAAPWYQHLTSRYVDVLEVMTPDDFREQTSAERKRKQYSHKRPLDQELIAKTRSRLGLSDATVVHPASMFRLFSNLWRERATIDLVDAFTAFRPLAERPRAAVEEAAAGLPPGYVVAKFYFSRAFPETPQNREFVGELLRRVSTQVPVALLSTSVRLDDHLDFQTTSASGLHIVDAHTVPEKNLERQTDLIAGARGFLGTYGGFSYLAPFYGVRSVSFFSRRKGFRNHHLDLANRIFDRLLPGGFLALDRRAGDLVDPAVTRWMDRPAAPAAEAAAEEVHAQDETADALT